jgi:hypothetical protein
VEECTRRLENYENEKVFLQREVIRFKQEAERTRPDSALPTQL